MFKNLILITKKPFPGVRIWSKESKIVRKVTKENKKDDYEQGRFQDNSDMRFNFAWKMGLTFAASTIYLSSDQKSKGKVILDEPDVKDIQPIQDVSIVDKVRTAIRNHDDPEFETEFAIFQPMIITRKEILLRWGITIFTAGIGFMILYPLWEWEYYSRVVRQLKWHKGKKLILEGDLFDFYALNISILGKNILTLGLYSILGFSKQAIAKYIDGCIVEINV